MKDKNGIKADGFHDSSSEKPGQGTPSSAVKSHPLSASLATGARWTGEGRILRSWQRFLTGLLHGLSLPGS
jgi:hypothetical protein